MDFETFIQSLLTFLKNCDNAYFVAYAVVSCLLTQLIKKVFVNKVDADILHKFDVAVVLPFVFGGAFAIFDIIVIKQTSNFDFAYVVDWAVSTATIGALATVIFKFVSSLSGKSLKSILKDDLFGAFYTQLLYFGTVREKLLNKEISLTDFIASVKLLKDNATVIYSSTLSAGEKREKLYALLQGVIDEQSITACLNVLDKALTKLVQSQKDK